MKNKLAIIVLSIVAVLIYTANYIKIKQYGSSSYTNQSPSVTSSSTLDEPLTYNNTEDSPSQIYSNYKHYINQQANFTIDYPSYLTRTEFYLEGQEGTGIPAPYNVYFCKTPLDTSKLDFTTSKQSCVGEGFRIQFTKYPGWGGGCDPENHDTLTMMGNQAGYCNYPSGFGQLYYGRPRNEENNNVYNPYEFLISGSYGNTLSNSEIKKIMGTFQVSDN